MLKRALNAPYLAWVLAGFSASYLIFFIWPVFLSGHGMQFFRYVPAFDSTGGDLSQMLSYSASLFLSKDTPYIGANLYPPLASVLFGSGLVVDFSLAYKLVTLLSVFCYALMTYVLPLRIGSEKRVSPVLVLVFVTGCLSYGFQFELERGQFNVIAVFLCFLAIWIFHYHSKYRYLAYALFTVSVQLKVYPVVFIIMLVSDWREWRSNLKRLSMLAVVNLALLFVLGPNVFVDFLRAIRVQTVNPYIWIGNHSIRSFVTQVSETASGHGMAGLNQFAELAQVTLLGGVIVCVLLIVVQSYRQRHRGLNSNLLLACTLAALVIPSVSNDYTLAILAAPVALFFSNGGFSQRGNGLRLQAVLVVLALAFSLAYSSTLFSFSNKPNLLANNFPALFVMLLIVTFCSFASPANIDGPLS